MRLTGSRCRCQSCGELFNSVSVFDRHRVGPWTDRGAARRCLTVAEMEARGWLRRVAGFWIERTFRNAHERLDRARRTDDRPQRIPVAAPELAYQQREALGIGRT
jgi:hypothetical protein